MFGSNLTTFGAALDAAKKGLRIARHSWNGKSMYLVLFSKADFITLTIGEGDPIPADISTVGYDSHIGDSGTGIEHIGITEDGRHFYPISDFFLLKTADNKVVPWTASQTDALAEDWFIVPKDSLR